MMRIRDVYDEANTGRYRTDPITTRIRDAITGFQHDTQRQPPS